MPIPAGESPIDIRLAVTSAGEAVTAVSAFGQDGTGIWVHSLARDASTLQLVPGAATGGAVDHGSFDAMGHGSAVNGADIVTSGGDVYVAWQQIASPATPQAPQPITVKTAKRLIGGPAGRFNPPITIETIQQAGFVSTETLLAAGGGHVYVTWHRPDTQGRGVIGYTDLTLADTVHVISTDPNPNIAFAAADASGTLIVTGSADPSGTRDSLVYAAVVAPGAASANAVELTPPGPVRGPEALAVAPDGNALILPDRIPDSEGQLVQIQASHRVARRQLWSDRRCLRRAGRRRREQQRCGRDRTRRYGAVGLACHGCRRHPQRPHPPERARRNATTVHSGYRPVDRRRRCRAAADRQRDRSSHRSGEHPLGLRRRLAGDRKHRDPRVRLARGAHHHGDRDGHGRQHRYPDPYGGRPRDGCAASRCFTCRVQPGPLQGRSRKHRVGGGGAARAQRPDVLREHPVADTQRPRDDRGRCPPREETDRRARPAVGAYRGADASCSPAVSTGRRSPQGATPRPSLPSMPPVDGRARSTPPSRSSAAETDSRGRVARHSLPDFRSRRERVDNLPAGRKNQLHVATGQ